MSDGFVSPVDFVGYDVADPNAFVPNPTMGFFGLLDFTGLPAGYQLVGGGKGSKFGPSHYIIQAMMYQQHSRSILDNQSMVVANVLRQRIAKQGTEYQREEIRRRQLLISSSLAVILSEV